MFTECCLQDLGVHIPSKRYTFKVFSLVGTDIDTLLQRLDKAALYKSNSLLNPPFRGLMQSTPYTWDTLVAFPTLRVPPHRYNRRIVRPSMTAYMPWLYPRCNFALGYFVGLWANTIANSMER